jgi:hypothetical protein
MTDAALLITVIGVMLHTLVVDVAALVALALDMARRFVRVASRTTDGMQTPTWRSVVRTGYERPSSMPSHQPPIRPP